MTKDSEEFLKDVSAIRTGNGNGLMGGFLRKQKQASTMALYDFYGTFPFESVHNKQREIQGYKEA
jgi:hypothetical protein